MSRHRVRRIALVILILVGCLVLADVNGFTWELRAQPRLWEAKRIADRLPQIRDVELLTSKEGYDSYRPWCGVVEVDRLYGTSVGSFESILGQFSRRMDSDEWVMTHADNRFQSFNASDGTIVSISAEYEDGKFDEAVIREGLQKYPLLFHIYVNALVYPNARKECR